VKIFVAMSGGVDSAVAALLLRRAGRQVVSIHLRTGVKGPAEGVGARPRCCGTDEAEDARRVCALLDIPFYVQNAEDEFGRLIADFVGAYARGETPNPCVACNTDIKFGALLERARALGADAVATGHYARRVRYRGRWAIARALDRSKDQSYVLYGLSSREIARARFPLGRLTKERVRRFAADAGLPVAGKPESQEICFVPTGDYRDLVRAERPDAWAPGEIVDAGGRVLGSHAGIASFTVGQRKGIGVAAAEPLYVLRLEPETRRVVVGPRSALGVREAGLDDVRWTAIEPGVAPLDVDVCLRYRAAPVRAMIESKEGRSARLRFDRPASPVTPGQSAVIYDGDVVLGGGRIRSCS